MTTVPLRPQPDLDDPAARQVFVDVEVRTDAGPLAQRWLLDTGAARSSAVDGPALAGLPRPETGTGGRGVSGAEVGGGHVVLPTVAVAGQELATDVEAGVVDPTSGVPGLLGADVLQGHRCLFAFSDGQLELDGERAGKGFLLELERPGNAPFVEVRGDGLHTRACWDTGAGGTVVDLAFARAHPQVFALTGAADDGTDAGGAGVAGIAGTMAPVRIGGTRFDATPVVAVDMSALNATLAWPLTIILGLPLIATADWWFDFPGNAWSVWRDA